MDLSLPLAPTPLMRLEYPPKDFSAALWSNLQRLFFIVPVWECAGLQLSNSRPG